VPIPLILTLAAGVASAGLYLGLLSGALGTALFANFAQLPLFAVGLMLGIGPALIAASAAIVVTLAAGGALFSLGFALIYAAPAAFMVRQALLNRRAADGTVEWYPPGNLVAWLCALGAAGFALMLVMGSGHDGGLEGFVHDAVEQVLRGASQGEAAGDAERTPPAAATEGAIAAIQSVARYIPGGLVASWIVMTTVNGALAQLIARRSGGARRPSPEMAQLDLPGWLPVAAALAGLAAFLPGTTGYVGINLVLILGLGFVFAGLAVIHARTRSWNQRRWWLVGIYLLSFTQAWPVLFIGLLGVFEPWANLRGRPATPPPTS
jgi:hypothetical protein